MILHGPSLSSAGGTGRDGTGPVWAENRDISALLYLASRPATGEGSEWSVNSRSASSIPFHSHELERQNTKGFSPGRREARPGIPRSRQRSAVAPCPS